MSFLSYRGVNMDIVHTRQIRREILTSRDGLAYHGQRWVLDCDCVYNPAAVAYAQPGPNGLFNGVPVAATNATAPNVVGTSVAARFVRGTLPAFTDASLRHWLMAPRGQLIYGVGNTILLLCPWLNYTCDIAGGPSVSVNDVTYVWENKTFIVSLKIIATVKEARQSALVKDAADVAYNGFPVLLSNMWRQHVDQDDDHFVELVTEGEAVFRLDELQRRGTTADQYRVGVSPLCPSNFHRGPMKWCVSEDGTKLQYQIIDRELAFNTPTRFGATRVEAYHTRQMVEPNVVAAAQLGLSFVLSAGSGQQRTSSAGGGPGTEDRHRTSWTSRVASGANTAISIGRALFPVVTRSATARAWGNRNTRRQQLASLAVGIVITRIGTGGILDSAQARMTEELSGKFVEFEMTHTRIWVPLNAAGANDPLQTDGVVPPSPMEFVVRTPRFNDNSPGFLQRATAQNLQPPFSQAPDGSGSRGTWTGVLTTQTMPPPEALPNIPRGNIDPVVDTTPT